MRAGAGYFYDLLSGQYTGNFGRANPLFGPPASGSSAATLQNPWAIPGGVVSAGPGYFGFVPGWIIPGNCATAVGKCTGKGSNTNVTSYQDLTVPLTYEWNMNVQYEFLPSWVLELGYVGSHGIHQASPGAVQNNTADGSPITIPYNAAQLLGRWPLRELRSQRCYRQYPAKYVPPRPGAWHTFKRRSVGDYKQLQIQQPASHGAASVRARIPAAGGVQLEPRLRASTHRQSTHIPM